VYCIINNFILFPVKYAIVGMDGTKHQSLLQPTEESGLSTRALPSHDFCDSRLYITPSAYRFMSHEVKEMDGELNIWLIKIYNQHDQGLLLKAALLLIFVNC